MMTTSNAKDVVINNDILNLACWNLVRRKKLYTKEDAMQLMKFVQLPFLLDKPQLRHRLYELCQLIYLNDASMWSGFVGIFPNKEVLSLFTEECNKNIQLGQQVTSNQLLIGLTEIALGNFDEGIFWFTKANNSYSEGNNTITPFFAYARSACPVSAVKKALKLQPHNFIRTDLNLKKLDKLSKPVLLITANIAYVQRFFLYYCQSLKGISSVLSVIHLHIIEDQDISNIATLLEEAKKILPVHLEVSIEKISSIQDSRSYFAMARFLIAQQLIELYDVPILITDMDFFLKGSSEQLALFLNEASYFDVAVVQPWGLQQIFPWLETLAGTFFVSNNQKGIEFLKLLNWTFLYLFNPFHLNWGIDQNILTAVVRYCHIQSTCYIGNMQKFKNTSPFAVPTDIKNKKTN